jgi:hypothetical protein
LSRGALLAVPVLALAACGGTTTSESLEDAARETAASSSRVVMSYRASNDSFRGTISGAFDYAGGRGIISDFHFVEDDKRFRDPSHPEEVRVIDGTDYVAYKIGAKIYWVKEPSERGGGDPFALLMPVPGGASDPSDVFAMILRASRKLENLGSEEVRGDEATHYRASVDVEKLADEVPAAQRDEYVKEARGEEPLPVDVWVDGEGRLRRVSIREEIEQDVDVVAAFELFDFGVDVEVEPPPADLLITQERLDELTGEVPAIVEKLETLCREQVPKDEADECKETEAGE